MCGRCAQRQERDMIDILLLPRRDRHAAERFFRKLLKAHGRVPRRLVTDRLSSYRAAHRVAMPSVVHDTTRYAINRIEVSHQPRLRAVQMRGFKSVAQAQQFLSVHGTRSQPLHLRAAFASRPLSSAPPYARVRHLERHRRSLASTRFRFRDGVVSPRSLT
jgi:transposase-like protein